MPRCADCLRDNAPALLTVDETARLLRVSKMTIYRFIESGGLPAIYIGRSIRLHAVDVDRLIGTPRAG